MISGEVFEEVISDEELWPNEVLVVRLFKKQVLILYPLSITKVREMELKVFAFQVRVSGDVFEEMISDDELWPDNNNEDI